MAYTVKNYRTKKQIKEDLAQGIKVEVFQPNADLSGATVPDNGTIYLEGPHYPEPHRWYATGKMVNGVLVSIK
jgi:hypothetical protein